MEAFVLTKWLYYSYSWFRKVVIDKCKYYTISKCFASLLFLKTKWKKRFKLIRVDHVSSIWLYFMACYIIHKRLVFHTIKLAASNLQVQYFFKEVEQLQKINCSWKYTIDWYLFQMAIYVVCASFKSGKKHDRR